MIEFKGTPSGKTLKYFINREKRMFVFCIFMTMVFFYYFYSSFVLILGLSVSALIIICPVKWLASLAPKRVYIDLEDRTILSEINSVEAFRMIDDIVKVTDYGEFYTFKFDPGTNQICFIAQKDLITQGTIEEFEEIFEEVLVRSK